MGNILRNWTKKGSSNNSFSYQNQI